MSKTEVSGPRTSATRRAQKQSCCGNHCIAIWRVFEAKNALCRLKQSGQLAGIDDSRLPKGKTCICKHSIDLEVLWYWSSFVKVLVRETMSQNIRTLHMIGVAQCLEKEGVQRSESSDLHHPAAMQEIEVIIIINALQFAC